MLWKLLSLRIRGAFSGKAIQGRGRWALILTAVLFVYLFAVVGALMYLFFSAISEPFAALGLQWFYFALAGLTAFTLAFVLTIFSAQFQLYDARDNELLLSMPLKPGLILASRMVFLWGMDLLLTALVLVPAGLAFGPMTPAMVLCLTAEILLLPCLSLSLAALAGWGAAALTGRAGRRRTLLTMILSLAFLAAYLVVYSQIQTILAALITNAQAMAGRLAPVLPLYHMGLAAATGGGWSLLITALCCLIPLALTVWLLSRSFLKIATRRHGAARVRYKGGPLRRSSAGSALLRRELRRLGGSAVYMMNSGIGALMLLLLAGAAVWKRDVLLPVLAQLPAPPAMLGCAAVCFVVSTITFTAPSVSLEGKTLWLLQSLPVDAWDVLRAKLRLQLLLASPVILLASLVMSWVMGAPALLWLPSALVPLAFNWFAACSGLAFNLLFPKLDWVSETAAVKQGISVLLAMLAAMAAVLLACAAYVPLSRCLPDAAVLLLLAALFSAAALVLSRWLRRSGAARFAALQA